MERKVLSELPWIGSLCWVAFLDGLSAEDRATVELASQLRDSGSLHPLIARLRDGELGPERARDVLRVLSEYDVDLLVQITLDGLISTYLEDPGLAHQPRRAVRSDMDGQRPGPPPPAGPERHAASEARATESAGPS